MSLLSQLFLDKVAPPPDNHGRRLLPVLLDEIAGTDPDRVIYSYAKTRDPSEGFQDVTAAPLARAVNRFAWHLVNLLGHGQDFPTITYMGPQDVMYAIFILACVKAGYKPLLTSPRNTLEAHLSLMEATDCETFARPPVFPLPIVKQILDARPMRVIDVPGPDYWLQDVFGGPVQYDRLFPYEKTYDEARPEPFCVLHTSGSTGIPKPVIQTHGTLSALDAFAASAEMGVGSAFPQTSAGNRVYLAFPLFHAAGIANFISGPLYAGFIPVLGPYPPSSDIADAMHVHGSVQESCVPPVVLVDLVKNPEHLENLSRLKRIIYGGGPLPKNAGDIIKTKTNLLNCMGSTEGSGMPVQDCPNDWEYIKLSPLLGYEYRHVSKDLYEQVIVRRPELEPYQAVFATFPDLQEWPMKDLYSPHPTRKDLWLYRGRTDDIIVFATGEKLNPLDMEDIITTHPAVNAALINGLGRFQSTLLVEAVKSPENAEEREELIEDLWPLVETANAASPSHARVHRHMITFTHADTPFLRAGKGTIQRKLTLKLYQKEFDELYAASEARMIGQGLHTNGTNGTKSSVNGHGKGYTNGSRRGNIQNALEEIVSISTGIDITGLDPQMDLFGLGLDSLQVTAISRRINDFLFQEGFESAVSTRNIYSNPTMASLFSLVSSIAGGDTSTSVIPPLSDAVKMENFYKHATRELPISARTPEKHDRDGLVVLLTGGTGSLGSYILDSLIRNIRIKQIYCLNRGPDSLKRQQEAQASRGLQKPNSPQVICLEGDVTRPYFGLRREEYGALLGSVTDIIHSAWKVDFNLSVESFQDHITGVRRLVDFSSHSKFNAHIFFVSSVSATGAVEGKITETEFDGWDVPQSMGYGQSKFVAERILSTAAQDADISATVCRVGQIAGPTVATGEWPKKEWLPSLIASSKTLKVLPDSLGSVNCLDWVPVDIVAGTISELVAGRPQATDDLFRAEVYHIANPWVTTWTDIVGDVARLLNSDGRIEVVPLQVWVKTLRDRSTEQASVEDVPALKLIDFFDMILNKANPNMLETTKTRKASKTLASVPPVQTEWLSNWMRQWGF